MYVDNIVDTTTTTLSLNPTTTADPVSTANTTAVMPTIGSTEFSPEEEIPITERPEFIVAMIVVALVAVLVFCVVVLCFVRPKQGSDGLRRTKQPLSLPPFTGMLTPPSTGTYDYSGFPSEHGWVPSQLPVVSNCC